jgi:hypothetical protein
MTHQNDAMHIMFDIHTFIHTFTHAYLVVPYVANPSKCTFFACPKTKQVDEIGIHLLICPKHSGWNSWLGMELLLWVSSTFFPKLWAKVRGSGYL